MEPIDKRYHEACNRIRAVCSSILVTANGYNARRPACNHAGTEVDHAIAPSWPWLSSSELSDRQQPLDCSRVASNVWSSLTTTCTASPAKSGDASARPLPPTQTIAPSRKFDAMHHSLQESTMLNVTTGIGASFCATVTVQR